VIRPGRADRRFVGAASLVALTIYEIFRPAPENGSPEPGGTCLGHAQSPDAGISAGRSTVRIGPLNQFLADTNHETTAYSATTPTMIGQ
jgi:hypothetical protein